MKNLLKITLIRIKYIQSIKIENIHDGKNCEWLDRNGFY